MKKNVKRKISITVLIVFLAVIAVLYAVIYLIPGISEAFTETYVVNYGSMEESYNSTGIIVRNEKCYFSEGDGTVSYYISEGEKIRIGTIVADVYSNSSKKSYNCEETGYISYFYDGLEEELTPNNVKTKAPAEYLNLTATADNDVDSVVSKGDFLFKWVDGGSWYIMLPVSKDQIHIFGTNSRFEIVLEDGTVLIAKNERIIGKDEMAVMAKVITYYPDFAKVRNVNVKVITDKYSGLEIPNSAIAYQEDNPGVYYLGTDDEFHFIRINIIAQKEDTSIVSEDSFTVEDESGESRILSTISLYDEILRDASK